MPKSPLKPKYLLDANVFVAFTNHSPFLQWVVAMNRTGMVASIAQVADELQSKSLVRFKKTLWSAVVSSLSSGCPNP